MVKKLPLYLKILLGLLLGVIYAFVSSAFGWNEFTIDWIAPFGTIFIRLLKFIAVPLVLFSIIGGVSNLSDITKLGRLAGKTLGMYLITTMTAVGIGLLFVNVVKPGNFVNEAQRLKNRIKYEKWAKSHSIQTPDRKDFTNDPQYADLVLAARSQVTEMTGEEKNVVASKMTAVQQNKNSSPLKFLVDMVPENIMLSISNNALMLQVIFFSIFFAIALKMISEDRAEPVINFINGVGEVFLKMVDIVMRAAPFFVFALLAGVIAKMADSPAEVFQIFKGLGLYSLTLLAGLAFLTFVLYPNLVSLFTKTISYRQFFRNISPAQLLAFSTSSSAATLPVTMECVEENMGVHKNISSFVLPVGATVNMDGTSLYQAVAVLFLAQLHMVDLTLVQQLTIVLTATLASIGAAAIPGASLIMMIVVLQSVSLNPAWIAIIFPVDRILDMCRTAVNVTGDATVATIIANSEGELTTIR